MRRLIGAFAGRTYHIVGNLMPWLNYYYIQECEGRAVGMMCVSVIPTDTDTGVF